MPETAPNPLLNTGEAATYLRLGPQTLNNWRSKGRGPKCVRLGRRVMYRQSDLDAYVEAAAAGRVA